MPRLPVKFPEIHALTEVVVRASSATYTRIGKNLGEVIAQDETTKFIKAIGAGTYPRIAG